MSAVICKQNYCMKTRLCNIFKTENVIMTLTKANLEIPHKVLQILQSIYPKTVSRFFTGLSTFTYF